MSLKKWMIPLVAAALIVSTAGSVFADQHTKVPGAVYSDQQAAGANKPVAQVQQELSKAGVKDVKPSDWFAGSITVMLQSGLLKPDITGQVKPEASVSNQSGVAIFAKVLGIAGSTDTDAQAFAKMQGTGLVPTSTSTTTSVTQPMNRLAVAELLGKALGVQPKMFVTKANYPFNDFEKTPPAQRGLLARLFEMGIFKGYEDRTFRPDEELTVAQIAILVDRILGAAPSKQ